MELDRTDFPSLYKVDAKGARRVWTVWSEGPYVHKSTGIDGGKQVVSKRLWSTLGKRSPEEVARDKAEAAWVKYVTKGYAPDPDDKRGTKMYTRVLAQKAEQGGQNRGVKTSSTTSTKGKPKAKLDTSNIPIIRPMLAVAHTPGKTPFDWSAGVYVDAKLDGIRGIIRVVDGEVVITTRGCNAIPHLTHLKAGLLPVLSGTDIVLDAELYCHHVDIEGRALTRNERHQLINDACKVARSKPHQHEHLVQAWVFDVVDLELDQDGRRKVLRRLFKGYDGDIMVKVPSKVVYTEEDAEAMSIAYRKDDHEGAVIRARDLMYKPGSRPRAMMKIKGVDEDEFKVVDAKEGQGTEIGAVVWRLETSDGKVFDARPMGTIEERRKLYRKRSKYIGLKGTVQYRGYGTDGRPKMPVFVCFRYDLD